MKISFEIEIFDNDVWNLEEMLTVHLTDPVGATLGELSVTTVCILNEDEFPNGEGDAEGFAMITAFITQLLHELEDPYKKAFMLQVTPSVLWLAGEVLTLVAVNAVSDVDSGETTLYFMGAMYLGAYALWHIGSEGDTQLRIGDRVTAILRGFIVVTLALALPS